MPKKTSSKKSSKKTSNKRKPTKKSGRCWSGYKPTPGKRPYSKGSCMKSK